MRCLTLRLIPPLQKENVGEIERAIRTIIELSRSVVSYKIYTILQKPMVIHLVYFAVLWLNNKPNILGFSQLHSPCEIITKRKLDWEKHNKAGFGDLVQASYNHNITNLVDDMRTYKGIYLGPTGNRQGTVNVFDLETFKVKKPHMIVYFPVPDRVIETVNKWGIKSQKGTRIHNIYFLNRHQNKYAWDNGNLDDNYKALVETNMPHPHLAA